MSLQPIIVGLRSYLPGSLATIGVDPLRKPGGTAAAAYCYSVWLRHLCEARLHGLDTSPRAVAEIGPGASLGVGLAALLTGAERYYALDAVPRTSDERNLQVQRDLVALLDARAAIPGEESYPRLKPALPDYAFPGAILTDDRLRGAARSLVPGAVTYVCPWERVDALPAASVDWIISQAVLEHVNDLDLVYRAMARWLRPGGVMSHQIDFKSHGTAKTWDGHRHYGDLVWKIIRGKRPYLINRAPLATHLRLLALHDFEVRHVDRTTTPATLTREQMAPQFRSLSEDDLTTSSAYVLAVKPTRTGHTG